MIGVTVFGLIFTPAFYVISRWLADRRGAERPSPTSQSATGGIISAPADYLMKFGVGQSVRRKEDDPLMRGDGRYVADHAPDGLSARPGGALAACACALQDQRRGKARAMPGVRLVLTGAGYRPISA